MVAIVLSAFTLIVLLAATVCDLRRMEIPDAVPLVLLVVAIVARIAGWSDQSWLSMASGWALGLAIGVVLFSLGGFGGGDVKVLASVGAAVGVTALGSVLFYTAIAGGIIAVAAAMRGLRYVPYAPAITAGFIVSWITRGSV